MVAARPVTDEPVEVLTTSGHDVAVPPRGNRVQNTIASAPCGPTIDLFSETPPNSAQPSGPCGGTSSENRTSPAASEVLPDAGSIVPKLRTYSRLFCSQSRFDSSVSRKLDPSSMYMTS